VKIVFRAIVFLFLAMVGMGGLAMSACGGLFAFGNRSDRSAGLLFLAFGLAIAAGAFVAAQKVIKRRDDDQSQE
jgi:hypothetical protein